MAASPEPARPLVQHDLFSENRRLAIVNGRMVGVGDAAGAFTVADIERTAVVFSAPSTASACACRSTRRNPPPVAR